VNKNWYRVAGETCGNKGFDVKAITEKRREAAGRSLPGVEGTFTSK